MDLESWADRASSSYIIGKPLFDFICDDVTRMYVATMVESVRVIPRTITRPYRCDSPENKRYMQMVISPDQNGLICISHQLIREEPISNPKFFRTASSSKKTATKRDMELEQSAYLIRCSICNRLKNKLSRQWQEIDSILEFSTNISSEINVVYGVCPNCMKELVKPKKIN